jgi:hypothetical protein
MPVMPVSGFQVAPRNKPARPDSKLQVEGMPHVAIPNRQPWQEARPFFSLSGLHCFPIFHV